MYHVIQHLLLKIGNTPKLPRQTQVSTAPAAQAQALVTKRPYLASEVAAGSISLTGGLRQAQAVRRASETAQVERYPPAWALPVYPTCVGTTEAKKRPRKWRGRPTKSTHEKSIEAFWEDPTVRIEGSYLLLVGCACAPVFPLAHHYQRVFPGVSKDLPLAVTATLKLKLGSSQA